MSKRNQEIPEIILDRLKTAPSWERAISETDFEIKKAQERVKRLRDAKRYFRKQIETGERFPVSKG